MLYEGTHMSDLPRDPSVPATFLYKEQVAEQFRTSRVTLNKRIKEGKVSVKEDANGKAFFDPAELERVFVRRKIVPVSGDKLKTLDETAKEIYEKAKLETLAVETERDDLQKKLKQVTQLHENAEAENSKAQKDIAYLQQNLNLIEDHSKKLSEAKDATSNLLANQLEEAKAEAKEARDTAKKATDDLLAEKSKGFFKKLFS